ncbi:hypothetical protein PR048_003869 [Dryococelus australis]|uniref:Uncharacterized protein n=1 Tax=Dryococelus australis TaxID=614101 RepID=A0ABQ9IQA8_9NEOP|nr:hypothetical protein PR048_003869 [Dryococelus australis]
MGFTQAEVLCTLTGVKRPPPSKAKTVRAFHPCSAVHCPGLDWNYRSRTDEAWPWRYSSFVGVGVMAITMLLGRGSDSLLLMRLSTWFVYVTLLTSRCTRLPTCTLKPAETSLLDNTLLYGYSKSSKRVSSGTLCRDCHLRGTLLHPQLSDLSGLAVIALSVLRQWRSRDINNYSRGCSMWWWFTVFSQRLAAGTIISYLGLHHGLVVPKPYPLLKTSQGVEDPSLHQSCVAAYTKTRANKRLSVITLSSEDDVSLDADVLTRGWRRKPVQVIQSDSEEEGISLTDLIKEPETNHGDTSEPGVATFADSEDMFADYEKQLIRGGGAVTFSGESSQHSPGAVWENHGKQKLEWPDEDSNLDPPAEVAENVVALQVKVDSTQRTVNKWQTAVADLATSQATHASSLLDFHMWELCWAMPLAREYSWGSPVSPTLSFWCCSILASVTLIGSQDVYIKTRPNLFTHSLINRMTMKNKAGGRRYLAPRCSLMQAAVWSLVQWTRGAVGHAEASNQQSQHKRNLVVHHCFCPVLEVYWVVLYYPCVPPTKVNQVQSPAGSLQDFRMWGSCRTMQLVD